MHKRSREMRYFAGEQQLSRVYFERNVKPMGRPTLEDGTLGEYVPATRMIDYKIIRPSLHKCDARCLNATGHNCECQCGGKNHGLNS